MVPALGVEIVPANAVAVIANVRRDAQRMDLKRLMIKLLLVIQSVYWRSQLGYDDVLENQIPPADC